MWRGEISWPSTACIPYCQQSAGHTFLSMLCTATALKPEHQSYQCCRDSRMYLRHIDDQDIAETGTHMHTKLGPSLKLFIYFVFSIFHLNAENNCPCIDVLTLDSCLRSPTSFQTRRRPSSIAGERRHSTSLQTSLPRMRPRHRGCRWQPPISCIPSGSLVGQAPCHGASMLQGHLPEQYSFVWNGLVVMLGTV